MRLWSIEFSYLDRAGILALWRESLLARKVIEGRTKGYRNHPQLKRFKQSKYPVVAINTYLYYVFREGQSRGYNFDKMKIKLDDVELSITIPCTEGQLEYEFQHLRKKLLERDIGAYNKIKDIARPQASGFFSVIEGPVEDWEVIKHPSD